MSPGDLPVGWAQNRPVQPDPDLFVKKNCLLKVFISGQTSYQVWPDSPEKDSADLINFAEDIKILVMSRKLLSRKRICFLKTDSRKYPADPDNFVRHRKISSDTEKNSLDLGHFD